MKLAPVVLSILCLGLAGLAVGCSENSETDEPIAGFDSGIAQVPVPAGAQPVKDLTSETTTAWEVPEMSYGELESWYEDKMPVGENWITWQWCDTGGSAQGDENGSGFARIYSKGARQILNITVIPDKTNAILIGTDNSGPC